MLNWESYDFVWYILYDSTKNNNLLCFIYHDITFMSYLECGRLLKNLSIEDKKLNG